MIAKFFGTYFIKVDYEITGSQTCFTKRLPAKKHFSYFLEIPYFLFLHSIILFNHKVKKTKKKQQQKKKTKEKHIYLSAFIESKVCKEQQSRHSGFTNNIGTFHSCAANSFVMRNYNENQESKAQMKSVR